jgi:hypothetical protein
MAVSISVVLCSIEAYTDDYSSQQVREDVLLVCQFPYLSMESFQLAFNVAHHRVHGP